MVKSKGMMMIKGYKISCKKEDMDLVAIHNYIVRSYWAKGISLETMNTAIKNSLCFGLFNHMNEQIGFARLITDQATFAYLSDVYVLEDHRGQGLSKWLLSEIIKHPNLQGLRRIVLATSDAHGLYQEFGFQALGAPDKFMELHQPNIYK